MSQASENIPMPPIEPSQPSADKAQAPDEKTAPAAEAEQPQKEGRFPDEGQVLDALQEVLDPEIGLSIVELGLVYDIICTKATGTVDVKMTLTSPGCPLGPEMTGAAYMIIMRLPQVKECHIDLVWEPMWDPQVNPTEEARAYLGIW